LSPDAHVGVLAAVALALVSPASLGAGGAAADACGLLTAADASAALGLPLDQGEPVFPNSVGTCVWKQHGRQATGYAQVTVTLTDTAAFDADKAPLQGVRKTPQSGVGDDAYYVELVAPSSAGGIATLSVKTGSVAFTVLVLNPLAAPERLKALEKDAAARILVNLRTR
jgi:hypothetical protein